MIYKKKLLKYEKTDSFGHVIVIVVQNEVDESESRNSAVDKVGICKCHSFVLLFIVYVMMSQDPVIIIGGC